MRRLAATSSIGACAMPGCCKAASSTAASTTATRPARPRCAASCRASAGVSMPAVTGSSAIATGRAVAGTACTVCSRSMICRVSAIDTCALAASSCAKAGLASRTSTESRIATTVAERGASVYRLISPMIWPRPISRSRRSMPSSSRM